MQKKKYIPLIGLAIVGAILGLYLSLTDVDTEVSETDVKFIKKILKVEEIEPLAGDRSFKEEVAFVSTIQDSVLTRVPHEGPIPFGQTREPWDVYNHGSGACYDRSRLIEKALRAYGFETVHLAIYYTHKRSAPLALITPGNPSHSISAVKTKKGWLVIDSSRRWLNVTEKLDLIPLNQLSKLEGEEGLSINWHPKYAKKYDNGIVRRTFVSVFGLYSRHGLAYPPFDRIPDVNWPEFYLNFAGLN